MEIFLEILIEIVVQIFGEALIELGVHSARSATRSQQKANPVLASLGYLLLGFIVGAASSFFWPRRITNDVLAVLNLIVAPGLVGLAMRAFGNARRHRGHTTTNLATFWGGACLAFGTALARLIFAAQMMP